MLFTVAISQLPFFLARCMNCRHLAMSNDEEQWNTRPAVSAVKRRAELSSTLTKTLYACDNLHCKTWQFCEQRVRSLEWATGTMVLSTPRWPQIRLSSGTFYTAYAEGL